MISAPTLFNVETPRLDGQSKIVREIDVVIEEMTNVLDHFGAGLRLKKTKEKIDQLAITFAPVFEEFELIEISRCKGKDDTVFTQWRNKIKQ